MVVPYDIIVGGSDSKLDLALKYYEVIPKDGSLDVAGIEQSFKELIDRDNQQSFGNFGWVVGYDSKRVVSDGNVSTRILRVNI